MTRQLGVEITGVVVNDQSPDVIVIDPGAPESVAIQLPGGPPGPPGPQGPPGPGADLVYNGTFPAGGPSYSDGDIVIQDGIVYLCVRPTSSPPVPW